MHGCDVVCRLLQKEVRSRRAAEGHIRACYCPLRVLARQDGTRGPTHAVSGKGTSGLCGSSGRASRERGNVGPGATKHIKNDADPVGGDTGAGERPRKSPRLAGDAVVPGLADPEQRKRRRADTGRQLRKRRATDMATEGRAQSGGAPGDSRVARRDRDDQAGRERSRDAVVIPRVSVGVRRSGRLSTCGSRPG